MSLPIHGPTAQLKSDYGTRPGLSNIRSGIVNYIAVVEGICGGDPVKLQSFGLALRSPASPPQPCVTVVGLITSVGDDEGVMNGAWDNQPQADCFEVQTSPDPITPTSWAHPSPASGAHHPQHSTINSQPAS
jgi:hypothetical protein